jgi:probable O-glycosylation ligase (exosortase A-associated)
LAAAIQFMPAHWHSRMASIAAYEDDASAQGRLDSWRYAMELAREHPVVGAGFEAFRGNKKPTPTGYAAAHSIYFEVLGEHGFVGLAIFLVLGVAAYRTAGSLARRCRTDRDLNWAANLASMIQVSFAAYAAAGLFLNLATFDLYYHLIAVVVIAHSLVRQALASAERAPSASVREHPVGARAW